MKIRSLFFFVATLLSMLAPLRAAKAPKLDLLLGEYKKARFDVLSKLNDAYASQADLLAQQFQAVPNLDGADRAHQFAQRLRNPDEKNDIYEAVANDAVNDPLAALQANYGRAREENLRNVYIFYASTAESLRRELLRMNDQAGANVLAEFLAKIKPPATKDTAHSGTTKVRMSSSK